MSNYVYLSLGSNLGDREKNLQYAVKRLSEMEGFEIVNMSPIYVNPAVEMEKDAPGFFNMIVKGEYSFRPTELLTAVENIETKLGRTNKGECKPRTIDIDIVMFGDEIVETDRLSIPHQKMTQRAFVLEPLLQIEPDLKHPVTKERLEKYLREQDLENFVIFKELVEVNV